MAIYSERQRVLVSQSRDISSSSSTSSAIYELANSQLVFLLALRLTSLIKPQWGYPHIGSVNCGHQWNLV